MIRVMTDEDFEALECIVYRHSCPSVHYHLNLISAHAYNTFLDMAAEDEARFLATLDSKEEL